MIRKAIIVVLMLCTVGLCALDIFSIVTVPHNPPCGTFYTSCLPRTSCPRLKLYSAIGGDHACYLEVMVWDHMIYYKHTAKSGKHSTGFQFIDSGFRWLSRVVPFVRFLNFIGFLDGMCTRRAGFPLWKPVTLLVSYPATAIIRGPLRRWRRRRKGLCLKCGYDLTGNESGICPECGTEVERA